MEKATLSKKDHWLRAGISLIMCGVLLLSSLAAGSAGITLADEEEGGETLLYPLMQPDEQTRLEWVVAYKNAPAAYIDPELSDTTGRGCPNGSEPPCRARVTCDWTTRQPWSPSSRTGTPAVSSCSTG